MSDGSDGTRRDGPDGIRRDGPDGTRRDGEPDGEPSAGGAARSGTGRPFVLGLTGGIGMGKSTVAAMIRARGVPVHDADATVHALYAPGGAAVGPIGAAFPDAVRGAEGERAVDRAALSAAVLGRPEAMARLEGIVHPLVRAAERDFLTAHADAPLVVLDIPLLFETGADARVDAVAVVSAPEPVRRARVLARPGMTREKYAAIVARQTPEAERLARAHHVIDTGVALSGTEVAVDALLRRLAPAAPRDDRADG